MSTKVCVHSDLWYKVQLWLGLLTGMEMMTETKMPIVIMSAAAEVDQRRFRGQMISR